MFTHTQLHAVARELRVNVVKLEQRVVNVREDLLDAVVRLEEGVDVRLEQSVYLPVRPQVSSHFPAQ
jgi:hypothetical protein